MVYIDPKHLGLEDCVVAINRVTKVVEGGRRLRFTVLIIAGDKNEHVGFSASKAQEVSEVICKAIEDTKRNLVETPMVDSTIPHKVTGVSGGGRIPMKPVVEGSGVAAGGPVRAVLELAGIVDITSKSLGSDTPINTVRATVEGLKQLKHAKEMAAPRGKSIEEIIG